MQAESTLEIEGNSFTIKSIGVSLSHENTKTVLVLRGIDGEILETLTMPNKTALHVGRMLVSTGSLALAHPEGGLHG